MSVNKAELIVHPVRLRIIELLLGRTLTPRQMAAELPEVPQATLYRQIKRLVDGGILRAAESRVIHGIVEKSYTMRPGAAHLGREEFAKISPADHERYFAVFLGVLTNRMNRYLRQPHPDIVEEGMTYFNATARMTDEEARQFRVDLLAWLEEHCDVTPGRRRRPRSISIAIVPDARSEPSTDENEILHIPIPLD